MVGIVLASALGFVGVVVGVSGTTGGYEILVGTQGERLMLALDDEVGLGQVDAVRTVHAVEGGQMLVDLENLAKTITDTALCGLG